MILSIPTDSPLSLRFGASHIDDETSDEAAQVEAPVEPVGEGGEYTYLRTLAEIYSPAYEDRASSPSGLHAYKLRAVPVLLASHRGQMVEVRVQP